MGRLNPKRHFPLDLESGFPTMTPGHYRWILKESGTKQTELARFIRYSPHTLKRWWYQDYITPRQIGFLKAYLGDYMFHQYVICYNRNLEADKIIDY